MGGQMGQHAKYKSQKISLHGKYFYNKFYPVGLLSGFLELVDDGVELIGLVLEGLHLLPDGVHGVGGAELSNELSLTKRGLARTMENQ